MREGMGLLVALSTGGFCWWSQSPSEERPGDVAVVARARYGEYEAVSRFRSLRRIGPPSAEARPYGPRLTSDGLPRWPERPIGPDLGIDMATYQVLDRGVRALVTRSASDSVSAIENECNEVCQLDSSTPF